MTISSVNSYWLESTTVATDTYEDQVLKLP